MFACTKKPPFLIFIAIVAVIAGIGIWSERDKLDDQPRFAPGTTLTGEWKEVTRVDNPNNSKVAYGFDWGKHPEWIHERFTHEGQTIELKTKLDGHAWIPLPPMTEVVLQTRMRAIYERHHVRGKTGYKWMPRLDIRFLSSTLDPKPGIAGSPNNTP